MSTTDPPITEEDSVSIISFDDGLYMEGDYPLPGSDIRIQRWLAQQCRFGLDVEKELATPDRIGPYALGGPGELLSSVLMMKQSTSTVSEEAALRADSPLLGFGGKGVEVEGDDDERTLMDPLHFPSPTYVRDLPGDSSIIKKHSPNSSHSSNTSAAAHVRSPSTNSSPRKISLALSPLSRRPSLFRQPSLPLLGELDDEQSSSSSTPQAISAPIIPQTGRSRAQSNASISSFHLPTSMQFSLQQPAVLTPIPSSPTSTSSPPMARRHSRMPPVSSTLASLSFGADDDDVKPLTSPIPRPHSQLHHPTHRHQPPPSSLPQKIPRAISRSSSTLSLSLLANNPNNRNAVYIDEDLDLKSKDLVDDDLIPPAMVAADGGEGSVDSPMAEDHRLQGEEAHTTPPYSSGVYYSAIGSSSQVYLGTAKRPTRPPPAPPLIIEGEDETGGLGGIGVINEDAPWSPDEERGQFGEEDSHRGMGSNISHHGHVESDIIRSESDFDSELHDTDVDEGGDRLKRFTSRWSLTSSTEENLNSPGGGGATSNAGGVVSAFGVGGGGSGGSGLFGSRKRRSVIGGGEKLVDKEKSVDKEKEREKEKEKEKEKSVDKKRGRLVSFISRISSNIASPPSSQNYSYTNEVFEMNTGPASPPLAPSLGFWFSDIVPPPPPSLSQNVGTGKKEKEKNKKSKEKVKEAVVGEELAEKEKGGEVKQVDGKDKPKENDKEKGNSLPSLSVETVEVVPAVHIVADASASADSTSKATQKLAPMQLRVDTTTHQQVPTAQFAQIPKPIPNHIISSPLTSSPLPLPSPSPDPQSQSQYLGPASSSKGLIRIASPIVKAFSDGFVSAGPALDFMGARSGSGEMVAGGSGGAGRVRSSSAADTLGRSVGGGGGYFDLYQHRQHLYQHQQQQQGPVAGPSQGQARQYTSPGPQGQYQQQQQQQQYEDEEQQQYRQRSHSQPLQPHHQSQSEIHQPQPQPQPYQSVTDYGSVPGGASSLRSPAATATFDGAGVANPHRPGLVKSVSTSMLGTSRDSGYGAGLANAGLPSSPVLFAVIPDNYEEEEEDEFEEEEEEEDDYGVEAQHGQWQGGSGGVDLAYDIDRERLEGHHEDSLRRRYVEEHSTTAATATTTPRVSTDMPPSSFTAPSHRSSTITRRSGSIGNIVGTHQTQEQRPPLLADNRQRLRSVTSLGNLSVVGNAPPTQTMKNMNGSSKGLRGFVERMKFTTTTTSSPASSSSSSPVIPPMAFAAAATPSTSSNASSPSLAHSPISFAMGNSTSGSSPFLNDGFYGPDQMKKRKKQPKRKLVIDGVSEDDVKGYEAVKAWCESFGEVREMKRTANGHLHVDFRKASVAETVCRLKTQVFIKGAGSVSLSWYTKEGLSKGLLP